MSIRALGIRGKLDLGLGIVLVVATLSFTMVYAEMERRTALAIEREHLAHIAELARSLLGETRDASAIQSRLDALGRRFREVGGLPHRLIVRSKDGALLAAFDPTASAPGDESESSWIQVLNRVQLRPTEMSITIPLWEEGDFAEGRAQPASVLVVSEPVPRVGKLFRTSVARHFGFAVFLVGLTLLACSILANRLILRPLRELVTATDEFARGGEWSPIAPRGRRHDEIGVLGDRLAAMSRRLFEVVRTERYHSAHLVGARAHRELEEPLRRASMHLTVLAEILPEGFEAVQVVGELEAEIERIRSTVLELGLLPDHPAP